MRFRKSGKSSNGAAGLKLFFCTDVHGSDQCFRKFLNSGKFFEVDHLILGGDMTGKLLVPVTRTGRGYSCKFDEHTYIDIGESEATELLKAIRSQGQYPFVGSEDEVEALEDSEHRDAVFRKLVYDTVADWVQLAEDRLRGTGMRCFMAPGNDDFLEIDAAIEGSSLVEFAEGKCLAVDDRHDMITTGYSNLTPWNTERELDEPELRARIDQMAAGVSDFSNLICVLHPPPYASEIDSAPALDAKLKMSMGASGVKMAAVGSTAVREFIEEREPLAGAPRSCARGPWSSSYRSHPVHQPWERIHGWNTRRSDRRALQR